MGRVNHGSVATPVESMVLSTEVPSSALKTSMAFCSPAAEAATAYRPPRRRRNKASDRP